MVYLFQGKPYFSKVPGGPTFPGVGGGGVPSFSRVGLISYNYANIYNL